MERAISGLPRSCEADAWEEEQRGLHRARSAGVKENSLSFLKLFQNAPCGDVVEITRLELVTYTLRTYRATNCAISPKL